MRDDAPRALRSLPSVDLVLKSPEAQALRVQFGRQALTEAVRAELDAAREAFRAACTPLPDVQTLTARAEARLQEANRPSLRPLFNLTGVVLHTNLGRAVLAEAAVEAATAAMRQAVSLEFDVESGRRGERDDHVRALVCELTGAEDATVVNNNAAAVLLVLNSLAQGRDAIVSRGELIEIGGAFRMPDIMVRAGARLVEVGTTNRTHPRDYAEAIGAETGLILKVHTSNYRIQGFTAEVDVPALATIARQAELPIVHDLGSGALVDLTPFGLEKEAAVREALSAGADLVTFSGDKLLGGPQAGFIAGRRDLIAKINRNPLKRALRVDKIRLAAIEATLKLYRDPDRLAQRLPTARLLARTRADMAAQAMRLCPALAAALGEDFAVEVADCLSEVGSGAQPLATRPSAGLAIRALGRNGALERLAARLRRLSTPVIGRIEDDALRLDLRCLEDEAGFLAVIAELAADRAGAGGMIVGTAGHIDHGKTALVRALTGVDTDRLKEEKARGITIDLGFAYLQAPEGEVIGFVDVPGHERFVRTMVAGASGIDVALLAVAADDGCKPQTFEHLAILDLLGVRRGLVALTKADAVTPEQLTEAEGEVRAALAGSTLEDADVLPVSALTGIGMAALRERLCGMAGDEIDRPVANRFRLAIDRAFTLAGAGVIVTGTVLSGEIRVGDRVVISPSGLPARVRGLHAQNCAAEAGRAGQRCALNLAGEGVSKDAIHRGDVALDPGLHAPADRIDAALRLAPGKSPLLRQWLPVRLHHAVADVAAHLVTLDDETVPAGGSTVVQLVLERPIAAAAGDGFIIRDASGQRTLGGGRFLDLRAPGRKRRTGERRLQLQALALKDPASVLRALLEAPPRHVDWNVFCRDHALSEGQAQALAAELDLVILDSAGEATALLPARWEAFASALEADLAAFHAEHPDLQGAGRERLRLSLEPRLPAPAFGVALQRLARKGDLALDGAFVRLATHTASLTEADEALWSEIAPLLGGAARFRPPRVRDIGETLCRPEGEVRRLCKLCTRLGRLDEVAHDHFFLRETVREMAQITAGLSAQAPDGVFTAAQFRDEVDNGRKVAIQILDFFDRHGVTLRRGDLRRINRHRLDLFGPLRTISEENRLR